MTRLAGYVAAVRSSIEERDATLEALSRSLTALSIVALVVGILTSSLSLDDYGLAGGLSTWYWLGLVSLPGAAILEWLRGDRASTRLMVIQLAAWFVVVWATPTLLEGTPRFRTSYVNYGYVDPIVRGNGLDGVRFLYHNWPLFSLLMAGVVAIGVSPEVLLTIFPLLAFASYLLVLPVFLIIVAAPSGRLDARAAMDSLRRPRVVTGSIVVASWLFLVFNWTGQDYFSPQALAYLLFLGFLAVLAIGARSPAGRLSPGLMGVALALFTAIVATHVLTSLYALAVLGALTLTRLIRPWTFAVTAIVIFLVWQVTVAAPFYSTYGDRLLDGLLRATTFFESNVADRVAGSPGHGTVVLLRIVAAGIVFLVGGLAGFVQLRRLRNDAALAFPAVGFMGVAVVTPISIYGGEALIRGLLFTLPFVLALVVLAADLRIVRIAVVGALLVGAPLHVFTHFGNELYDYVPPGELEGYRYIAANAPANVYGGFPAYAYQNTVLLDGRNATVARAGTAPSLDDYLAPQDHAWAREDWPMLVAITRGDDAAQRLFRNETTLLDRARAALAASDEFELLFENDDMVIYRWLPPDAAAVAP
jgi:hypothetical protein